MRNKFFTILSLLSASVFLPIDGMAKTCICKTDSTICITNEKVSITFPKEKNFDILSLKLANGIELVKQGANTSPWTLTYKGEQGETPEIEPRFAIYKGYREESNDTSKTLVFQWNTRLKYDGQPYPVEMRVTLGDSSELIEWNLSANVPQNWVITNFSFPNIAIATPEKGEVITPGGWGNLYELKESGNYEANYPSWNASMQMVMLNWNDGAFYYSPEDYNACGKMMRVREESGNVKFKTEVVASYGWTDSATHLFRVPWTTVTGHHPEGWSKAALKWYRPFALTTEWGSKTLEERNIPEWIVEKDLWMRAKYLGDTTVTAVNKAIDYFGDNLCFHWYFWHNHAYDSHYPDYFPAQPEFEPIIRQVRSRNCQVMPYINGRLWDPATESYSSKNGKDASCRRPDGTLYTEVYPTSIVPNTVTCPSSPIWKNVILELADRIQNELHTDGLYIDQIAAAAPYPCYASNHNHPAGGGEFWYHSYRDMMNELRASHLKKNNVVFSEENAECYIPCFDILLTVNTPHSPNCKIIPLYPLIYSDRVLTCAYTYTPYTDVTQGEFRYQNMQCFLYGAQLGWVDPRLLWVNEKSEYEAQFLRNLTELRKKQHDVFIGGRYLREFIPQGDNPIIDVPTFGKDYMVKGAEWLKPNGEKVLYVVNSDSKQHTVILPDGTSVTLPPISGKRFDL